MGRAPCCEKVGLKRGRWTGEEDEILIKYIQKNGEGSWRSLPKNAGLLRCGKSCRLRWINYLRADLKRGNFTAEEDETIIKLHRSVGNRWSFIASHLPGRTDNEVKNYWNSHLSRKIYSFRSSNGSLVTTSVDLIKMANTCKRRGGRVSRSVAKKYKNIGSIIRQQSRPNPESPHQATENDATSGVVIHDFSTTGNEKEFDQANAVGLHAHDQKSGEKDLEMELVDIYEEEAERRSINSMHDSCCEGLEMFSSALLGRSPRELEGEIEVLGPYDQEHNNYVSTAIFDKIFQNELSDITQNISNYEEKEKEEGTISSTPDSTMISSNERDNSGAPGNLHAETGKHFQCFSPINSSYFEDDLVKWDLDEAIAAFGFGLWDGGDDILLWP